MQKEAVKEQQQSKANVKYTGKNPEDTIPPTSIVITHINRRSTGRDCQTGFKNKRQDPTICCP